MAQARQKVVTKKLIPCVPPNLPPEQMKAWEADQVRQAQERLRATEADSLIPAEASVTLRFRLSKHGRHWQAYAYDETRPANKKWYPLLPAPSLLSSALGVLESEMYTQAVGA